MDARLASEGDLTVSAKERLMIGDLACLSINGRRHEPVADC